MSERDPSHPLSGVSSGDAEQRVEGQSPAFFEGVKEADISAGDKETTTQPQPKNVSEDTEDTIEPVPVVSSRDVQQAGEEHSPGSSGDMEEAKRSPGNKETTTQPQLKKSSRDIVVTIEPIPRTSYGDVEKIEEVLPGPSGGMVATIEPIPGTSCGDVEKIEEVLNGSSGDGKATIERVPGATKSSKADEGGEMGPEGGKEFPFALSEVTPVSAPPVEESPLPDVVIKLAPDFDTQEDAAVNEEFEHKETHLAIFLQVFLPFLIAGLGMVGAGIYLDYVQNWEVFKRVPEIIILVPALLGLKGNLEMTLASRLSTEANLGHMDQPKEQWSMILANLTLVQCQAIVVGFMSAVTAIILQAVLWQEYNLDHSLLLCCCSIITSSIASLVLGLITAAVIVLSRCFNINPDNVATPIAASLGDITSLALLSWVAQMLYQAIDKSHWISPIIISCYILVIPFWVWIAKKNKYTKTVLYTGWVPVMAAMLISTFGGLILDNKMANNKNMAVYQPVINGVGGNLVSVQASRLSTELHKLTELGDLPPASRVCISPINAFFSKKSHAVTARVLMLLVVPGHLIFLHTIAYVKGENPPTTLFFITYLTAVLLQVAILLYISYVMTYFFWIRKVDPDNSTIPYLTALGDLLGIVLLAVTFEILYLIGDRKRK